MLRAVPLTWETAASRVTEFRSCILSFAIVKSGAVAVQDDGCGRIKMDKVGRLKTSAIDT